MREHHLLASIRRVFGAAQNPLLAQPQKGLNVVIHPPLQISVDWLNAGLSVERGIVRQRVENVKTIYSGRKMSIGPEMLTVLKTWRQRTQFSAENDWMFASPTMIGRQPWSYDQVWRSFVRAAVTAGIGKLGTHSMRHTYRSWLDAAGTTVAVQQKLMRHGDIRTTMNVYGDVVTNEMQEAHSKVIQMALPRPN
jgi:integrase